MLLTIGRSDKNCRLAVLAQKIELKRLFGLLFVISVVPPIMWGVGARAVQAEEREERRFGDVGEGAVATPSAAPERIAEPASRGVFPAQSFERNTTPGMLPSAAEIYSSTPQLGDALRSERIRNAERALAIRRSVAAGSVSKPSEDLQDLVVLAQADAPSDRPADLPAEADDDDDDDKDDAQAVDLSTITPVRVAAPQAAAAGAGSSSVGRGPLLPPNAPLTPPSEGPAGGEAPASSSSAPYRGALSSLANTDQPASAGPRESVQTSPAQASGTTQTRRRARTALHSVAAQAAASMATDSPYRNALSGQDRYRAPMDNIGGQDLAAIEGGLSRVSESLSIIRGLHLQNVSVFGGYSSNGISNRRNSRVAVGPDYDYGASATMAYIRDFRRTNFRMLYSPSYSARTRYSEWNTADHRLRLNAGRQLSRRWTLGASASATNSGLESFWVEAPILREVENPPASFDELFRMVEAGELTDDEFAAVLTGAPVVDDEGGQGLDLSRVLNVSASANARYAYSPRLSFSVTGSLANTELLDDASFGRRVGATGRGNVTELRRTSVNGSMHYSLNRSSRFNVSHSQTQQLSTFRSNRTQRTSVGFDQSLGRSWNYGFSVGIGSVTQGSLQDMQFDDELLIGLPIDPRPTWTAGGNLSYRYRAHRFQVQAGRSVGDTFGLGSRSSIRGGAGWSWSTRDASWSANASASYMKSQNGLTGFYDTSVLTRSLGAGINRRVSSTTYLQTSYYFGEFDSPFRGLFVNNSVHRVQASFVWSPAQLR